MVYVNQLISPFLNLQQTIVKNCLTTGDSLHIFPNYFTEQIVTFKLELTQCAIQLIISLLIVIR